MTKIIFYYLIPILTLLSGDEKDLKNSNTEDPCSFNANAQTVNHNGLNRAYMLYIPDSYDATTAVPMVMNFHGFGASASDYMLQADMRSLAESQGFILVYPQGSCIDGFAHWNPCPLGEGNKSNADDLGFVETVIDDISSQYKIDRTRIYATGYSNGGMMAYGLAHYKSELIAAVASVSGTMLNCMGTTDHPMPVMHLHGTSDRVIPYQGNSYYSSAENVLNYWIDFNNTATKPTVSSDSKTATTVEHYSYGQGDRGVCVEHYKFKGGNHEWFTEKYQGQTTAELIWSFVSRYDIKGLR